MRKNIYAYNIPDNNRPNLSSSLIANRENRFCLKFNLRQFWCIVLFFVSYLGALAQSEVVVHPQIKGNHTIYLFVGRSSPDAARLQRLNTRLTNSVPGFISLSHSEKKEIEVRLILNTKETSSENRDFILGVATETYGYSKYSLKK